MCFGVSTYGLCPRTTMLPSIAYDCASELPAGASTVKTAMAMNETASRGLTDGRAPRATASRPAPTPMVATIAAAHSVNRTKSSGRWSESHQGGPPDVCAIAGTATAHTSGGPPWWLSLHLPDDFDLFTLWAAAIVATIGVGAGLLAVARGARPSVKPLLAVSFLAIAVFAVLAPAGSSDAQSYAIDGNMVVLGHSPYVDTPKHMAELGDKLAENSPVTWQSDLSDYGPVATAEEWVSAELGGSSMAAITFWLKLWVAIAF